MRLAHELKMAIAGNVLMLVRRSCHWGPIIALSLVTIVTSSSTYCLFQLSVLPNVVVFKSVHNVICYSWIALILKNFFQAMMGPGNLPLKWSPSNAKDRKFLQECKLCEGYKAPRAHHCRQCRRCVMKMDHHCPWINVCVGHHNHAAFTRFVFYTPLGCLHASLVNANFLYRLFTGAYRQNPSFFPINEYWLLFAIIGGTLGVGVSLAVGILFAVQIKGILKNRTQIEEWIEDKAIRRRWRNSRLRDDSDEEEEEEESSSDEVGQVKTTKEKASKQNKKTHSKPFVYPYDLGWRRNLSQVINWSGRPLGNGVDYPVRKGCSKYDFTVEQIEQKKEKRTRMYKAAIAIQYGGVCCVCKFGVWTCLSGPCDLMEGERIPVAIGDRVIISRWKSKWFYGDRVLTEDQRRTLKRVKGWFPKGCVDPTSVRRYNDKTD